MSAVNQNTVTVKIMDKEYKVHCPLDKVSDLKQAANTLDEKMREVRKKTVGLDNIAILTALNFSYELLNQQQEKDAYIKDMNSKITKLCDRISAQIGEADSK